MQNLRQLRSKKDNSSVAYFIREFYMTCTTNELVLPAELIDKSAITSLGVKLQFSQFLLNMKRCVAFAWKLTRL